MANEVKTILVQLRFAVEKGDQQAAQSAIDQLENKTQTLGKTVKTAEENFRSLRMAARELTQVGMFLTAAGAAIIGPLTLAANTYIKAAGSSEAVSEKWLENQKSLEESTIRIGRVAAESMLPALEKGAEIMSHIADFAEKHPDAIKAALGVGVVLAGLGAATVTAAELLKVVADVGLLLQKLNLVSGVSSQAANTTATVTNTAALEANTIAQGGKAAGLTGAVAGKTGILAGAAPALGVIGSVGGGILIGDAISRALGNMGIIEFMKKTSIISANLVGGSRFAQWDANMLGYGTSKSTNTSTSMMTDQQKSYMQAFVDNYKTEQAAHKKYLDTVAKGTRDFQQQQTKELQSFNDNEAQIEQDGQRKREQELRNFAEQEAQTAQDNTIKRVKEIRDFAEQEATAEADYYKQRMDAAKTYSIDVQRMEQDHQTQMRRLSQDHSQNMLELAQANDVLGAYREIASYNKERQRAEQDYQTQAKRKSQDFAHQVNDMEANFQFEEARRQDNFKQQVADEDAQNAIEAQRRADQFKQQVKDEDAQANLEKQRRKDEFNKQRIQERQDFIQKMNDLAQQFMDEEKLRYQAYVQQLTDLNGALAAEKSLRDAYNQAMIDSFKSMTGTGSGNANNSSVITNNNSANFNGLTGPQMDKYVNQWAQQSFK